MHEGDQEKIGEMKSYQNERRKVFQGERREQHKKEKKGCQNTKLWRKKRQKAERRKKFVKSRYNK